MIKKDLLKKYKHVFEQPVTLYENFNSSRIKECKETITEEKAVTLFAEAEVFDNYSGPGRIVRYKASGKNHLEAVKKIIDKLGFDITSKDIEKESYDFEEVLEQIDMLNGEGDAFLINLKDDQGNEFYVHEGYEQDYEDLDEAKAFDFDKLNKKLHGNVKL